MSTSQEQSFCNGGHLVERINSEKVEKIGKNVGDIVLGNIQRGNGKLKSLSKENSNLTFERKDSIFPNSLEQSCSKRSHRLLKQADCKDHSHANRKITKQSEFQLDSSSDCVYFVSSVDRRDRGSKKFREAHLEERNLYREAIARSQSQSRSTQCKRSSYPPRAVLPKSGSQPWALDEELQAVRSCPTLRREGHSTDHCCPPKGFSSMEYSTKNKVSLNRGTKQEHLTYNGESKQNFERMRSNSTGERIYEKGSLRKRKENFNRKPPKAPSWQSLLNPTPTIDTASSSSEKKKLSNKTESKLPLETSKLFNKSESRLPPETLVKEQKAEGPKPPKPPSWQSLTIPQKCHQTCSSVSLLDNDKVRIARSSNSSENGREQTIYSEDVEEDDGSVSEMSVQSETVDPFQKPVRKINIKRTRSRLIDSSEVPKQESVVRLAQAKPFEYNLRETQFDNMVYLRENAERCQRWLQSLDDRVVNGSSYLDGKTVVKGKDFLHEKFSFIASPYPSSDSTQDTL